VALLWKVVVFLHKVVAAIGVIGAELAEVSASRGGAERGGVNGCVHVIGRSDEGVLRYGG